MQDYPEQKIDIKAVKYWRLSGCIASLFYCLIPGGYFLAMHIWKWPGWVLILIILLTVLSATYAIVFKPSVRWKTWRYDVSAQEIDLYYGILVKHRIIIPMVRVQHVDTEQGPILRRYGLSSVTIHTAAGEHEIPALADKVAGELRKRIAELARVVDEDV